VARPEHPGDEGRESTEHEPPRGERAAGDAGRAGYGMRSVYL